MNVVIRIRKHEPVKASAEERKCRQQCEETDGTLQKNEENSCLIVGICSYGIHALFLC